jgi:ssDNA-binding Zn-finger/Zn-ribbon topoisomerase 1
MTLLLHGRKPKPPEPSEDEATIVCYNCGHHWNVEMNYNLASYGTINCPKCEATNEIGD